MLFPLASASSFNASTNGGNMIFVYYTGRAGPTQFIVIKLLLNICDFFFFYLGFSFTNTHESQNCRVKWRAFL